MIERSDRQLVSARREESEMEAYLRYSSREKASCITMSEHEILLKRREDELSTEMRQQLVKGHVDMRRQTAEAVELYCSEHHAEVARLEEDKQHFVNALAESMNEVTRLRSKHQDYGEWEYDEEYKEEGGDDDDFTRQAS